MSESPTFEVRGLSKAWGRGGVRLTVLDDVQLSLHPGSATWVGGRNGVGKTTLLRIAAGMLAPDAGTIRLSRFDPVRDRRRYQSRVGFLSAGDRGLYPRLTVRRHLDFWARIAFVPRSRRRGLIDLALRRFQLMPLADRRADRLSLGQRQRLRIALTLLHEPKLLLLDEPCNSLDAEGVGLFHEAVVEELAHGGVALWCSPSIEDAPLPCDSRFLLDGGKLTPA